MHSGSRDGIYSEGLNRKTSENLGAFATLFQTEIVAITLTAREIFHRNLNNKKIVKLSDNQAAIKALSSLAIWNIV